MDKLTVKQAAILNKADKSGQSPEPTELKKVRGFHFCPDWDYLPICNNSPEKEGCVCKGGDTMWDQKNISEWSKKTFGDSSAQPMVRATRMNIEVAELLSEIEHNQIEAAKVECADIFIVLAQVAEALGCDLMEEVQKKMDINEKRKWEQLEDGRHQHL